MVGHDSSPAGLHPAEKFLELRSPLGAEPARYEWPLKKGKGSVRRSEDKEDETAEILETIRWVGEDVPEIREALDKSGILAVYDPKSFESMEALCNVYNKAIDKLVASERGTAKPEGRKSRVTRPHLKHILQKCYNKSVIDPNELNHYEAFTPEVYGETSFELICQILDKLHPISSDNKFVDLGSGVGQVVLQVAALTDCTTSLGIEKAHTPAKYAKEMERWFKFWMGFYGKVYSDFKLVAGDFLDRENRPGILESTIVFVNNFAFGPEVDQHLKDIFADLNDGARIFSSKSFCALNFRITDRNLSDIGTIMHVSKMDPLKGSVSWTGKPVSYYLHVIDRAKLERYFQKSAARKGEKDMEEGKRTRRSGPLLIDESSSGSRDNSRASSIEADVGQLSVGESPSQSRRSWADTSRGQSDEDIAEGDDSNTSTGRPRRRGRKPRGPTHNRRVAVIKLTGQSSSDEALGEPSTPLTDSNSCAPPPPEISAPGHDATGRPIRAAVANAAAISEAQFDMQQAAKKSKGRQKRILPTSSGSMSPNNNSNSSMASGNTSITSGTGGRRGKNARIAAKISGLDFLHATTLEAIKNSNEDSNAPTGCVNERLAVDNPQRLVHEELPLSLSTGEDGKPIPFQLQVHLDRLKRQYLSFIRHMKDPTFKSRIESDIALEKKKNVELVKRQKQLKAQIDTLINDSLGLLKCRLNDLGIQAKTPPEFIEKAKGIVNHHHDLQRNKAGVEAEVRQLEIEQEKIILAKEKEMLDHLLKIPGMTMSEARKRVKITIENTINSLQGSDNKVSPLLNKLADVTLTKCGPQGQGQAGQSDHMSTQIRKRPREYSTKQRDWPEKRCKGGPSPTSSTPGGEWPEAMAKIEEKNPEVLAKKIIAQGRSLENKTKVVSPRNNASGVEVRMYKPNPAVSAAASRYVSSQTPPTSSTSLVDLPRVDLTASMSGAAAASVSNNNPELVLPPHPDSRSRSSEHTEEVPFASNKMSSTPRAGQFEDRLKTIIHSVLSGEADKQHPDVGPPLQMPRSASPNNHSGGGTNNKPMFSPVKKELPARLPPPPSGIMDSYKRHPYMPQQQQSGGQPPNSSVRTMNDIIEREIERNLDINHHQRNSMRDFRMPSHSHSGPTSPQKIVRHASLNSPSPGPPSASTMSRMSQVIEDSIRGHVVAASGRPKQDLEGLACPRTKSPNNPPRLNGDEQGQHQQQQQQQGSSNVQPPPPPQHEYPAMEGLGARFNSYLDKRSSSSSGARFPPQPVVSSPPTSAWQQQPQEAHQYRSQYYHHQYNSAGSLPPQPPRKRTSTPTSSSSSSAVLPPKKQHVDTSGQPSGSGDMRFQKDNDNGQKWQDEINSGFDRLVAYATEVDKRRKSTDSNSPVRPCSRGGEDGLTRKSPVMDDVFDSNRTSMLSMKFKGAGYTRTNPGVLANSPYTRAPPVAAAHSKSSLMPSAMASVASLEEHNRACSPSTTTSGRDRSPLPGENLPEHHFKKRYFAETRDASSSNAALLSSYTLSPVLNRKRNSLSGGISLPARSPVDSSSNNNRFSPASTPPTAKTEPTSSSSVLDSTMP